MHPPRAVAYLLDDLQRDLTGLAVYFYCVI